MNIHQIAAVHGYTVNTARAIIEAAVEHAENKLNLEYNSPAGRMSSEEAERALWLVRDFALASTLEEEIGYLPEIDGFDPYVDDAKEWRDE